LEEIKIMTMDNLEETLLFEKQRLKGDEMEKEFASWNAPWRREALNHYLPQGWSFIKKVDGEVVSYVLCQPILFFQSWTQTLWVEHVSAIDTKSGLEMLEIAFRWAKDKHLQKIFFKQNLDYVEQIDFGTTNNDGALVSMNTTRT
jgi:hypothetical protein